MDYLCQGVRWRPRTLIPPPLIVAARDALPIALITLLTRQLQPSLLVAYAGVAWPDPIGHCAKRMR